VEFIFEKENTGVSVEMGDGVGEMGSWEKGHAERGASRLVAGLLSTHVHQKTHAA
jgi:hypothetical protein